MVGAAFVIYVPRLGGVEPWPMRLDYAGIIADGQTWVAEREGGNGTTEEFQELAEQVSGEDLDGFFTAWLVTGERPAHSPENGF